MKKLKSNEKQEVESLKAENPKPRLLLRIPNNKRMSRRQRRKDRKRNREIAEEKAEERGEKIARGDRVSSDVSPTRRRRSKRRLVNNNSGGSFNNNNNNMVSVVSFYHILESTPCQIVFILFLLVCLVFLVSMFRSRV